MEMWVFVLMSLLNSRNDEDVRVLITMWIDFLGGKVEEELEPLCPRALHDLRWRHLTRKVFAVARTKSLADQKQFWSEALALRSLTVKLAWEIPWPEDVSEKRFDDVEDFLDGLMVGETLLQVDAFGKTDDLVGLKNFLDKEFVPVG
jgi:hypothetical protein